METIDCGCGAVSTRQPVIQRRNGKAVSEYNSDVMDEGAIITDETDEERTCLLGGGAGRSPIDRVFGGLRDSVYKPSKCKDCSGVPYLSQYAFAFLSKVLRYSL